MLKRLLSLLAALTLLLNCAAAETAAAGQQNHTLEMKTVPFYFKQVDIWDYILIGVGALELIGIIVTLVRGKQ